MVAKKLETREAKARQISRLVGILSAGGFGALGVATGAAAQSLPPGERGAAMAAAYIVSYLAVTVTAAGIYSGGSKNIEALKARAKKEAAQRFPEQDKAKVDRYVEKYMDSKEVRDFLYQRKGIKSISVRRD
jgi:cell division protein FtsX